MMTNPRLISAGTLAVAALLLTGCAGGGEPAPAGTSAGAFGDTTEITFVNPGGEWLEAILDVWGRSFTDETGIKVNGDSPSDLAAVVKQVESGNVSYDVVEITPQLTMDPYCGVYWEKLSPEIFTAAPIIEGYSNECGVATNGYANVMFYNENTYGADGPESWADFFDTKKFPGVRALLNDASGVNLEIALLADGVAPEDLYPLDYDRAYAKLDTIRDDLVFWDSGAQATQMMEAEEVDMLMSWSTRGRTALANGAPFVPVWNQHILNMNVQAIPLGSKNKAAAEAFILHNLEKEQQEEIPSHFPALPARQGVEPTLDEYTARVFVNQERIDAAVRMDHPWLAAHREEMLKLWTAWINK